MPTTVIVTYNRILLSNCVILRSFISVECRVRLFVCNKLVATILKESSWRQALYRADCPTVHPIVGLTVTCGDRNVRFFSACSVHLLAVTLASHRSSTLQNEVNAGLGF